MPVCCAVGCSNSRAKGFKLFHLPNGTNDQERRKIWLTNIKRDFEPSRHTCLCEIHFELSEFEKHLPNKLKPSAVPTLFSYKGEPIRRKPPEEHVITEDFCLTKRIRLEHSYDLGYGKARTIIESSPQIEDILPELPTNIAPALEQESPTDYRLPPSHDDVEALKRALEVSRKQIARVERENKMLKQKFGSFLNQDQLLLLSGKGCVTWSEETIKKALQLRAACGYDGYQVLIEQGYPLPSHRTLRRRLHSS